MARNIAAAALILIATALSVHTSARAEGLSIAGTIWEDANVNGVRDLDEKPVRIVNVSLFKDGAEVSRIQPDDLGHYAFDGLQPGQYTVRLTQAPDSFFWTYPNRRSLGPYETAVELTAASVDTIDFGLASLERLPHFFGFAWLDGQPIVAADVRAFVGGTDCTAGGPEIARDILPPSTWQLSVLSSAYRPGCADSGSPISFTLNGRPAILTLNQVSAEVPTWAPDQPGHPRYQLVAGSPFSSFEAFLAGVDGDGDRKPDSLAGSIIEAFVGNVRCGRAVMLHLPQQFITVAGAELLQGCGVPDSPIRFLVNGSPVTFVKGGRVVDTEPWLEGLRGNSLTFTLAEPQLLPPATGNGGLFDSRGSAGR